MVNKVFDCIINKMGTLIGHNVQWTSKFCKNVFVKAILPQYEHEIIVPS